MNFLEKFKDKIQILNKQGINELIKKSNTNPVQKNHLRFSLGPQSQMNQRSGNDQRYSNLVQNNYCYQRQKPWSVQANQNWTNQMASKLRNKFQNYDQNITGMTNNFGNNQVQTKRISEDFQRIQQYSRTYDTSMVAQLPVLQVRNAQQQQQDIYNNTYTVSTGLKYLPQDQQQMNDLHNIDFGKELRQNNLRNSLRLSMPSMIKIQQFQRTSQSQQGSQEQLQYIQLPSMTQQPSSSQQQSWKNTNSYQNKNEIFTPYTLKQYKQIQTIKNIQRGLGPNINTDDWLMRRNKQEKMKQYTQKLEFQKQMTLIKQQGNAVAKDQEFEEMHQSEPVDGRLGRKQLGNLENQHYDFLNKVEELYY